MHMHAEEDKYGEELLGRSWKLIEFQIMVKLFADNE